MYYTKLEAQMATERRQISTAMAAVESAFAGSTVCPLTGAIEVVTDDFEAIFSAQPIAGHYTGRTAEGMVVSVPCH